MTRVLIFGTFDLLHPGHRSFMKQAKKHGEHLTVVVGRDDVVHRLKKRWPVQPLAERMAAVRRVPEVNKVVAGMPKNYLLHLKREQPHVIALGYDQTHFTQHLQRDLQKLGLAKTIILRLKPFQPQRYKTSIVKKNLRSMRRGGQRTKR